MSGPLGTVKEVRTDPFADFALCLPDTLAEVEAHIGLPQSVSGLLDRSVRSALSVNCTWCLQRTVSGVAVG
jgi:hypothetical protein